MASLTDLATASANAPLYGILGLSGQLYGGAAPTPEDAQYGTPQQMLARVLQFDPNAHLQDETHYGPEGPQTRQQLIFDKGKLPAPVIDNPTYIRPNSSDFRILNPNLVFNDPNYGAITPQANQVPVNQTQLLDILGPMVVGGAIGLGGGFSMLGNLFSKLPNVASMGSSFLQQPAAPAITPQQLALYSLLRSRGY